VTLELFNCKRQSRELATHPQGVVTQITATLRLRSGWSGQYGLLDSSCKPSPFRAGLLTENQGLEIASLRQATARLPYEDASYAMTGMRDQELLYIDNKKRLDV
jgi:hypothetical protein